MKHDLAKIDHNGNSVVLKKNFETPPEKAGFLVKIAKRYTYSLEEETV
jgi:hypothetical protein